LWRTIHTFLYCKQARDSSDADVPEEAEESGGNKVGSGNGSESNKAGNKSDITVEVGSEPVPKAKSKHKATELVRAAKGRKDGAKHMKVTTGKPAAEVKAKPAVKAAAVKTPAKGKTPPKSPSKSPSKKK